MAVKKSTNTFTKTQPRKSGNGWAGDNLTSDAFGADEQFTGTPFGVQKEFGGVKHFETSKDNP